ncbi:MAG: 50S ribosome-binding GTPase [Oscillatoria princeps RMCB-10]|jgi:GTPase Era involved in 16S rRNA processing|nr:50S ribosome-binding GTPase [Oscillatoria princeps RMCB-10]
MEPIKIAIAGQQNVGKTTLIRTLTKSNIGEVEDRAGVTTEAEHCYFKDMQATFIDTPGFQRAGEMVMYFRDPEKFLEINPNFESDNADDFKAIQAVKESDVVVYVADLADVPKPAHQSEVLLVRQNHQKVVAVLNQYQQTVRATNEAKVKQRINQWETLFKERGIPLISFDAHWDNPVKVEKIYEIIFQILDDQQKLRFKEGLNLFKKRQADIRQEACKFLAEFIEDCRKEASYTIQKSDFNEERVQNDIVRKINGNFAYFTYCVTDLYKIAAENPTTSKDELLLKMRPKAHWGNRIGIGGGAAAILGGVTALISGILGAGIGGLLTGGVGAIPVGLAWAQIGGTIGGAIGSLGIFSDHGDTVTIEIDIEQLKTLLIKGVAIIWGLSNTGYGREKKLSSDEARQLEEQIWRIQEAFKGIDLGKSNTSTIREYCEQILDKLEKESY